MASAFVISDFRTVKGALRAQLNALVTLDLAGATLRLYANDYTPSVNTEIGDLTEATFGGYAAVTLTTWSVAQSNGDGSAYAVGPEAAFSASGVAPGNIIYGWFILTVVAGHALCLAGRFDNPVPMSAVGDALFLIPTFKMPSVL